jgi:hypothetical protein
MVTIKIKENSKQAKAVLEMLKTFAFVEIVTNPIQETKSSLSSKEKTYLNRLKKSAKEMEELSSGKRKGQTLQSFLNEL